MTRTNYRTQNVEFITEFNTLHSVEVF